MNWIDMKESLQTKPNARQSAEWSSISHKCMVDWIATKVGPLTGLDDTRA